MSYKNRDASQSQHTLACMAGRSMHLYNGLELLTVYHRLYVCNNRDLSLSRISLRGNRSVSKHCFSNRV